MALEISLDFETFSWAKLVGKTGVGARCYSEHPTTVVCLQYSINYAEPVLWLSSMRKPLWMLDPEGHDVHYTAWNCEFEYWIMKNVVGVHVPGPSRWTDTMALATHLSLPRSLANCTAALGFSEDAQKKKTGNRLIQLLSQPQKNSQRPDRAYDRSDRRELLHQFYDYCAQDVRAEQGVGRVLPPMSPIDRACWEEHMRINLRGMPIDVMNVQRAQAMNVEWRERSMDRLKELTGLANPNSGAQMHQWLATQGVELPDLTMDTLRQVLNLHESDDE